MYREQNIFKISSNLRKCTKLRNLWDGETGELLPRSFWEKKRAVGCSACETIVTFYKVLLLPSLNNWSLERGFSCFCLCFLWKGFCFLLSESLCLPVSPCCVRGFFSLWRAICMRIWWEWEMVMMRSCDEIVVCLP